MEYTEKRFGGRPCRLYGSASARFLLVQPVDSHGLMGMDRETAYIADHTDAPFLLACFPVADWNRDLSPWPAPPVFGNEAFGGGAGDTLNWLQKELLPGLLREVRTQADAKTILGGYSLAGLFALWAAHTAGGWDGVAAASPSVWYPQWMEYAAGHPMRAKAVYLSLGDREEKTRNPLMARVGDNIRAMAAMYQQDENLASALVWNEGNHFRDADIRTGKAFAWTMEQL